MTINYDEAYTRLFHLAQEAAKTPQDKAMVDALFDNYLIHPADDEDELEFDFEGEDEERVIAMPGGADCVECRKFIEEGEPAVNVSAWDSPNGEGWRHAECPREVSE